MSTAYHPQTDGQTERINGVIEQYLRNYVNYQQGDWVTLLPMAQFAYNNGENATTGMSPFYANYGRHPDIIGKPNNKEPEAPRAKTYADVMDAIYIGLKRDIEFMTKKAALYYDNRRMEAPDFKRGDGTFKKAFLLQQKVKTKRPCQKLDHIRLGPFTIEEKLGPVTYRLRLPKSMKKMHPVFHVSLLEPAPDGMETPNDIELDEDTEQEYEVEEILDKTRVNGQVRYLVKWKGYTNDENTWEPISNLTDCRQAIKKFHDQHKRFHQLHSTLVMKEVADWDR